ncbi:RHS repeat protein [Occallatibacter riparius]|uniref:RHS repeat protein n=1 Tax=Occallatibacter riparius TaxID=1002689 RepID=A0A9J7BW90_9BACT|nr:RHS repeat protein [Occallatibacter riparius]UWZ85277.1 hypothetical protein MOP44_04885 [Occallatibacter riparius]
MKTAFIFALGMLLPLTTVSTAAQQPPGNLADANNPSGPPGPMQAPSIWKVDPLTGALTIQIPLNKPLSGGRGPHYGDILSYNSSSTVTLQFEGISQQGQENLAAYSWVGADQTPPSFAPNGPWTSNGPVIYTNGQSIPDQPIYGVVNGVPTQVGTIQGCNITGPSLYNSTDGATHDLNVVSVVLNNTLSNYSGTNPNCNYTNTTSSATTDSSGLQTFLTNNVPSAIEPDGTTISQSGYLEDSNGNVNHFQDSEGRRVDGKYGPGGALLSYTTTSQKITLGSFAMPHPLTSEITAPYAPGTGGMTIAVDNTPANSSVTGITSIQYPDKTSYQFGYTPNAQCANQIVYGTITSITFPTGGNVEFCWAIRNIGRKTPSISAFSTLVVTDIFLSDGSGTTGHWTYSYQDLSSSGITTTETAPDGTTTTFSSNQAFAYGTIFNHDLAGTYQETQRDISNGGNHLRSVATSYYSYSPGYGMPYQVTTTYWDVSPAVKQTVQYSYDSWGNVTEKDESDFYSGSSIPWLRKTFTTYAYSQAYCPQTPTSCATAASLAAAHVVNKPSQVVIADGNGVPYSIARYGYDETALCSNSQICLTSGALNHDDTNYAVGRQSGRGNLTSEAHCAVISSGSCTSWLVSTNTYDLTGQRVGSTDPKGNTTTYSYTDTGNFSAGAPGSEGTTFTYGTSSSPTNSFLHKVTYATGAYDTYQYDYFTGGRTSHADWSQNLTGYSFDYMGRPLSVSNPDGGGSTFCYSDEGGATCNAKPPPFFAYSSTAAAPSATRNANVQYDGLARPTTVTAASGAESDTTYDSMGRVESTCNPYATGSSTSGCITYAYDGLGRVRYKCNQDNGNGSGPCVPGSSYEQWSYSGATVTFTDENRNSWVRTGDGLGRVTLVVEPNAAKTYYVYDPLGNLTCAAQDGGSGGTFTSCAAAPATWRPRKFTYDSLSRLLTAYNPETGTVCYGVWSSGACGGGYDADGNLVARTDARGVVTSFAYDSLNRLLSKTYSSAPAGALSSCYQYDNRPNGTGRLAAEWTQTGACPPSPPAGYQSLRKIGAYDVMGRIVSEQQCVAGYCTSAAVPSTPAVNCTALSGNNGLQYCFDEAGNLLAFSSGTTTGSVGNYPQAAMTFSQTFDLAGRLSTVASSWNDGTHPASLFTAQGYTPFDALSNWLIGPHIAAGRSYDNRLRVTGQTGAQQ